FALYAFSNRLRASAPLRRSNLPLFDPSFRRFAVRSGRGQMSCKSCKSENQSRLATEIAIHLPGLNTPHLFLYPRLLVCLDCGFTEFSIPEAELRRLMERDLKE